MRDSPVYLLGSARLRRHQRAPQYTKCGIRERIARPHWRPKRCAQAMVAGMILDFGGQVEARQPSPQGGGHRYRQLAAPRRPRGAILSKRFWNGQLQAELERLTSAIGFNLLDCHLRGRRYRRGAGDRIVVVLVAAVAVVLEIKLQRLAAREVMD